MKILRAILLGALLWVLIFFEVSILMFGFNLSEGLIYYIVHYIFLALFTILVSLIYFRSRKLKGGFLHGFLLGLILIFTGIILDVVITVPLWIGNYYFFFYDFYLLIGYLEVLILACVIGIARV